MPLFRLLLSVWKTFAVQFQADMCCAMCVHVRMWIQENSIKPKSKVLLVDIKIYKRIYFHSSCIMVSVCVLNLYPWTNIFPSFLKLSVNWYGYTWRPCARDFATASERIKVNKENAKTTEKETLQATRRGMSKAADAPNEWRNNTRSVLPSIERAAYCYCLVENIRKANRIISIHWNWKLLKFN